MSVCQPLSAPASAVVPNQVITRRWLRAARSLRRRLGSVETELPIEAMYCGVDLDTMVKFASQIGLPLGISVSDPAQLSEQTLQHILHAHPQWLSISLDGADAVTHDHYHGTANGFTNGFKALERFRHIGLRTRLVTHLRHHNVDQLERLSLIPQWIGIERWTVILAKPETNVVDDAPLNDGEKKQTLKQLERIKRYSSGFILEITSSVKDHHPHRLWVNDKPRRANDMVDNGTTPPLKKQRTKSVVWEKLAAFACRILPSDNPHHA